MIKFLFLFLVFPLNNAENFVETDIEAITKAIVSGNADDLGPYFCELMDVKLFDTENVCKKEKAVTLVKEFFANNKPSLFELRSKNATTGGMIMYQGFMQCGKKTFSVYIFTKMINEKEIIHELIFE